jgi:hypothetical protein
MQDQRIPAEGGLFICGGCGARLEPAAVVAIDGVGNVYCDVCAGKNDAYREGVDSALEVMLRAAIAGARAEGWGARQVRAVVESEFDGVWRTAIDDRRNGGDG